VVATGRDRAGRRAERRGDPARRRRLLRFRLLRRRDPHAAHRRAGGRRAALHRLHHGADVCAGACRAADRQGPALGRLRLAHPRQPRIPGVPGGRDQPRRADAGRAAEGPRLVHLCGRQVAQHARRPGARRRRSGVVAAAARLRQVLRFHGCGDQLLLAGPPGRGQRLRGARCLSRRLLLHRRLDRPRDRLAARAPLGRLAQAVLPLPRPQRAARAAAGAGARRRAIPRRLRRRLGRAAPAALRAPARARRRARRLAAAGAVARRAALGRDRPAPPRGDGALHGALRGDDRQRRPEPRSAARLPA
jgi:hypothetical protein